MVEDLEINQLVVSQFVLEFIVMFPLPIVFQPQNGKTVQRHDASLSNASKSSQKTFLESMKFVGSMLDLAGSFFCLAPFSCRFCWCFWVYHGPMVQIMI